MNRQQIIGNLVRDPESHATNSGSMVCSFTVAVDQYRGADRDPVTEYFRVSAFGKLGDNCQRYLSKGKKVYVCGPSSSNAYIGQDGEAHGSIDILANEVEFLSPSGN